MPIPFSTTFGTLPVDINKPEAERQKKLDYMLRLIDLAQILGTKDLLVFHEFPLHGFEFGWSREQVLRVAIDVPGPETERIGEKAKQYNCYIHFGCYGKLPDWPGHFHNMGIIIGPSGEIIYQRWKLFNWPGLGFSTTVHDVFDEYVAHYGWDAVFPVVRTDIGNLSVCSEIMEPEAGRICAMKGVEIVIRYVTAGAGKWTLTPYVYYGGGDHTFRNDFLATCLTSNYYGIFVNNSLPVFEGLEFDLGSGDTAIIDCNGRIMAEAASIRDTMVTAVIPLASYRKKHSIPNIPKELYQHFYNEEFVSKYPPNTFRESLPDGVREAAERYNKLARW